MNTPTFTSEATLYQSKRRYVSGDAPTFASEAGARKSSLRQSSRKWWAVD